MHVSLQTGLAHAHGTAGFAAAAVVALLVAGCGHGAPAARTPAGDPARNPAALHFYRAQVQPVLQTHCLRCHAGMNRKGGLDMSTRARLLQGGKDGAVVVPGRPEDSLLLRVVGDTLPPSDPMRMPGEGMRLSAEQVASIRKWIADGVVMDR